jgi:hypothetical protein
MFTINFGVTMLYGDGLSLLKGLLGVVGEFLKIHVLKDKHSFQVVPVKWSGPTHHLEHPNSA